jgi:hypothetical protein
MLSLILWILGGAIVLGVLYFIGTVVFAIFSLKKIFGFAKEEASDLPKDYANFRKEVKNENASEGTEKLVKTVFVRWYQKLLK